MKLGVNIDHVATIRQARGTAYPEPVVAAKIAEAHGADQITFHLREDRRHIQDRDLPQLKAAVRIPLNMEMAATPEMVKIASRLNPYSVTFVPEKRRELTTEGGLNLARHKNRLGEYSRKLQQYGIKVSLFIDPTLQDTDLAHALKVDHVEFHTGTYCDAKTHRQRQQQWQRLLQCCQYAKECGLYVAAGHGLNYENIQEVLKIKEIEEYNIGHSIVAESIYSGFGEAVAKMKQLLTGSTD
ncbi:MAG: pyridoxine 5'-phosphate synthase [Deltaproteobacteria bacterium]|nr:pyridoxine 5'-phosphate synthase [Deltaproteobacteria bacterium]